MKSFVFDTNAVIGIVNKKIKLNNFDLIISVITELELLSFSKLSKSDEMELIRLFKNFIIIGLNENIKQKTIEFRRKYHLKLPDSIIASTAFVNNAFLVTDDSHFKVIDEISVMNLEDYLK